MAAQAGDIVAITSGVKYVVMELLGNPIGGLNARLIRPERNGRYTGLSKGTSGLTVIQSPSFVSGERVTVDGSNGCYLGTENGIARVLLARRRKQTKAGDFIGIDASVARVPIGLLVLENRPI